MSTRLAVPPRARLVDPTRCASLRGFSCGTSTSFEREVNAIVAGLCAGPPPTDILVRVTEDVSTGELLGLCGLGPRPFHPALGHAPVLDAAYITVIAVSLAARGRRLPDNSRIGDFMLGDALQQIQHHTGGGPMPPVWALIDSSNHASHNLFDGHRFGRIPPPPNCRYDVRWRPRGLPL